MTIEERVERLERLLTDTTTESDTAEDIEANHWQEMAKKLHDAMEGGYPVRIKWNWDEYYTGVVESVNDDTFLMNDHDYLISNIERVEMLNYHYLAKSFEHTKDDMARAIAQFGKELSKVIHGREETSDCDEPEPQQGIENEKWERWGYDILKQNSDCDHTLVCQLSALGNIDVKKTANLIAIAPELAKAALEYVNSILADPICTTTRVHNLIKLLRKAGIQNVAPWYTDE